MTITFGLPPAGAAGRNGACEAAANAPFSRVRLSSARLKLCLLEADVNAYLQLTVVRGGRGDCAISCTSDRWPRRGELRMIERVKSLEPEVHDRLVFHRQAKITLDTDVQAVKSRRTENVPARVPKRVRGP